MAHTYHSHPRKTRALQTLTRPTTSNEFIYQSKNSLWTILIKDMKVNGIFYKLLEKELTTDSLALYGLQFEVNQFGISD